MTNRIGNGGDGSRGGAMMPPKFFDGGGAERLYLDDPAARALLEFFEHKGLAALKDEDRRETFYFDWMAWQGKHGIYASLLTPAKFSRCGGRFDLLRYARLLELFAYCSPAHGYSLQVTSLGFFSILMGTNEALKIEAAAALEAGDVLGFGVSEKEHGSDLLAGEFCMARDASGGLMARGKKHYIGNLDVAAMISTLGRVADEPRVSSRLPLVLVALRPGRAGFESQGKIHTFGVRAGNVGAFEAKEYRLPEGDVIARGRDAWDAVFGAVTLGKFFLGFGSIGICEHAFEEAVTHLRARIMYGKPVIEMPHIGAAVAQARARLTAMKLYAFRALDYVHAASESDRRYQFYCAVQKARVSTEGVKVMALLSECMGARGFDGETFFEMALRDTPLIPVLEGSMHINLGIAAQFLGRYFVRGKGIERPPSLAGGETASRENTYLMEAQTGGTGRVEFGNFLEAYRSLRGLPNVAMFARQAAAFRNGVWKQKARRESAELRMTMAIGECLSTIAYGQLIAEAGESGSVGREVLAEIFGLLVQDLNNAAIRLAVLPGMDKRWRREISRMIKLPQM